jgi:hypothetical protein
MPRPKISLEHIETIPVVFDFLVEAEKSGLLKKKQIRRYLLDLNVMYPYINAEFKTFDNFLELDKNKKALFFNKFKELEFNKRMSTGKITDKTNCLNRILQIVWNVQGLLGYLSRDKDFRANSKWLESITPNPKFIIPITIDDVYDLYDECKSRDRKALKIEFFTGYNPIDLVNLSLSDFKPIDVNNEFYYVHKKRQKTWKKQVNFLNVFDSTFYYELVRYCDRNNISEMEPIFQISPIGLYKSYKRVLEKNDYNQYVTPKWIRQLSFTRLEPVLGPDTALFSLWTQHQMGVLSTHYIKKFVSQYIELYPKICDAVLLGSIKKSQEKIKILKDEILIKIEEQDKKIKNLEEKSKTEEKIDEILNLLKNKI